MSHLFHRKDTKKNLGKTKGRQLSKDMIGLPQADFIHAFHIGVSGKEKIYIINLKKKWIILGETFGDVTCLAGVEKTDLIKLPIEKSPSMIDGNW